MLVSPPLSRLVLSANSLKLVLNPLGQAPITPPVFATSRACSSLIVRAAIGPAVVDLSRRRMAPEGGGETICAGEGHLRHCFSYT